MNHVTRTAVLAAAVSFLAASPLFAQDLLHPLPGLDLDPFHILTPAPPPPAEAAVPHHHHRRLHHSVGHHHAKLHHAAKKA